MAGGEQQLLGLAGEGQSVFALLQKSQVLLARYLELQFLDLADYPHTSKHVHRAAHGARTIHGDIVALFQRFSVTAKHIVHTLMPRLLEGIDLEEPSLVAGAFHEVLSCETEMSSGYNDVHSRYKKLAAEIGECYIKITDASQINKELSAAEEDVRTLIEEMTKYEEKQRDIQQQVVKIDDDIEKQKEERVANVQLKATHDTIPYASDRATWATNDDGNDQVSGQRSAQKYPSGESYNEERVTNVQLKAPHETKPYASDRATLATNDDGNDQVSGQRSAQKYPSGESYNEGAAVTSVQPKASHDIRKNEAGIAGEGSKSRWSLPNPSSWGKRLLSMYNTVHSSISRHGNSALEEKRRRQKLDLQKQIEETGTQMTDICSKIEAKNKHIRELEEEKRQKEAETPINVEGVIYAENVMKPMMFHLSQICEFWTTTSQIIQPLADEQGASHVYRSAIESDSVKSTFLKKISLSQQGWERLNALCMDYVRHFQQDPVEGLGRIFAFLSAPIGQPRGVIEARISELRRVV